MMYHISSLLHGKQTVRPETKPNLQYKETWIKLVQENHRAFCTMYASENISQEIEARLGWRKSKLFCECIFELCRQQIDNNRLYPRIQSVYLSATVEEIENFKKYANRTGTVFEVNIDIQQCQRYDMNLFTKAETYLSSQTVLTEAVFENCCSIAYDYWRGVVSDCPEFEYLYYGDAEFSPLISD